MPNFDSAGLNDFDILHRDGGKEEEEEETGHHGDHYRTQLRLTLLSLAVESTKSSGSDLVKLF